MKSRITIQARSGINLFEKVRSSFFPRATTASLDFMRASHVADLLTYLGKEGLHVKDDKLRLELHYETSEQQIEVAKINSPAELSGAVQDYAMSGGTLCAMMFCDKPNLFATGFPDIYNDDSTICDLVSEDGGIVGKIEYYKNRGSDSRVASKIEYFAGICGSSKIFYPIAGFVAGMVLNAVTHNTELTRDVMVGGVGLAFLMFPPSNYLRLNSLKDGITVNLEYVGNTSEQLAGYNQIVHDLKHLKLGKSQPLISASPLEQIVSPETSLNI